MQDVGPRLIHDSLLRIRQFVKESHRDDNSVYATLDVVVFMHEFKGVVEKQILAGMPQRGYYCAWRCHRSMSSSHPSHSACVPFDTKGGFARAVTECKIITLCAVAGPLGA